MLSDTDRVKIVSWFNRFCGMYGVATDLYDVNAHIDSGLSVHENIGLIRKDLKPLIKPMDSLSIAEVKGVEDERQRIIESNKAKVLDDFRKHLLPRPFASNKVERMFAYMDMVHKGLNNCCIFRSLPGQGKTHTVLNFLQDKGIDFVYKSGYITPLSFYLLIAKNPDKYIFLDDMDGLFSDSKLISLFKAATFSVSGERLVSYESTSSLLGDAPSSFIFTGKLFVCCNDVFDPDAELIKPLLSRCIYYNVSYAFDELLTIARQIVFSDLSGRDAEIAFSIIERNILPVDGLNLRLVKDIVSFVKYDPVIAEELFLDVWFPDTDLRLVDSLVKSGLPKKEMIKCFIEETGLSRRSFYRLLKKYNCAICAKKYGGL